MPVPKYLRWPRNILLTFLVLIAFLLTTVRLFVVIVAHNKEFVETQLSRILHRTVTVKSIEGKWATLVPQLNVQEVILKDPVHHNIFLQVHHLTLILNIMDSMRHGNLIPERLIIQGLHLNMTQEKKMIYVDGSKSEPGAHKRSGSMSTFYEILIWLIAKGNVIVKNMTVHYHSANSCTYGVRGINLKIRNQFSHHSIVGYGFVDQPASARLNFVAYLSDINLLNAKLNAKIHLQLKNIHLNSKNIVPLLLPKIFEINNKIDRIGIFKNLNKIAVSPGQSDFECWADWHQGMIKTVRGRWHIKDMALDFISSHQHLQIARKHLLTINNMAAGFSWNANRAKHIWSFETDPIDLIINHHRWPHNHFRYRQSESKGKKIVQYFHLDYFSLNDWRDFLSILNGIPLPFKQFLEQKQLRGVFQNISFSRTVSSIDDSQLYFDFEDVAMKPNAEFPGFDGLSGAFLGNKERGTFFFKVSDGHIFLPKKVRSPLPVHLSETELEWQKTKTGYQFYVPDFQWNIAGLSSRGWIFLMYPMLGKPEVVMLSRYHLPKISGLTRFIPNLHRSPSLIHWLGQAFHHGILETGTIIYRGPITAFPFKKHQAHLFADFHIRGMGLSYFYGWQPLSSLNGNIVVNNLHASAHFKNALIGLIPISYIDIQLDDFLHPLLKIRTNLDATVQQVRRFILQSLLNHKKARQQALTFLPKCATEKCRRRSTRLTLKLNLDFRKPKLAVTSSGRVNLLGNPMRFHLKTRLTEVKLSVDGWINLNKHSVIGSDIKHWKLLENISGKTSYHADFHFYPVNNHQLLSADLYTNLKGLQVSELPAVINKSANQDKPTKIHLSLYRDKPSFITVKGQDDLLLQLFFKYQDQRFKMLHGEIYVGIPPAEIVAKKKNKASSGLAIYGNMKQLKWGSCKLVVKAFFHEENGAIKISKIFGLPLILLDLYFDRFAIYHQTLHHMHFKLKARPHNWLFVIRSPEVEGTFFAPNYSGGTWAGNFDHLYMQGTEGSGKIKKRDKNTPLLLRPELIPPIDVVIKKLSYKKINYGTLKLRVGHKDGGVLIKNCTISGPLFHLLLKGKWQDSPGPRTSISGIFRTESLGQLLWTHHFKKVIKQAHGTAHFQLAWPGAPNAIHLDKLTGHFILKMYQGRLMNTNKDMMKILSLGRLINVFKVESLPKRLMLDFSDITEKGLKFYSVTGDLDLNKGMGTTKGIVLDGPVVRIKFRGLVNFIANDYDLNIVVRPYFTASLPLVIGVAAGPVAGAIAWVVNKITAVEIGKAAGFIYHAKGNFSQLKGNSTASSSIAQVSLIREKHRKLFLRQEIYP